MGRRTETANRKLDERLCEDPVRRLQNSRARVLGRERDTGKLYVCYHNLSENTDERIISEDSFRETYFVNPLFYLTQKGRESIPEVRENITKTRLYHFVLDKICKKNTEDLSEAQRQEIIVEKKRLIEVDALQDLLPQFID